ncbi:FAD-dependent oxidoreductase [Enterococcus sp. AZ072]|uniref:FAD-dependent oxidoreductase n=1 Tax=unclassified Enterococcus TaxID=2608891 RepID=UPI003D29CE02
MRIVIIGGSFAGIQAAITSREYYPFADIILLEKQPEIGYIPGSLSLLLQDKIADLNQLHWVTLQKLTVDYQIDVQCNQTVVGLTDEGRLQVAANEIVSFDRLIIATGSGQFSRYGSTDERPGARILRFKTKGEAQQLLNQLPEAQKVAVIGAGQVGLEIAEGLQTINKEVHLFESNPQLLFRYLDSEMTQPLVEAVQAAGVQLHLNAYVEDLLEKNEQVLLTAAGEQTAFDLVLVATNTRPDNSLWEKALILNDDGTIQVDSWMQTSRTNVFAVGDAIQVSFQPTGEAMYISLVNNAIRTAKLAAANLNGPKKADPGTLRTIGNYLFGYYVGSTGLTESEGIFYPGTLETQTLELPVHLFTTETQRIKMIFDQETKELLGAQLLSRMPVLEALNRLAAAIRLKETKEQLLQSEEYFHPALNTPQTLFARIEDRHED